MALRLFLLWLLDQGVELEANQSQALVLDACLGALLA
jgi:hypothetical protein